MHPYTTPIDPHPAIIFVPPVRPHRVVWRKILWPCRPVRRHPPVHHECAIRWWPRSASHIRPRSSRVDRSNEIISQPPVRTWNHPSDDRSSRDADHSVRHSQWYRGHHRWSKTRWMVRVYPHLHLRRW